MRFNCGPTWQERTALRECWHRWFAWYPVRVGTRDCRWLETIERRGKYWAFYGGAGWDWEYRPVTDTEGEGE